MKKRETTISYFTLLKLHYHASSLGDFVRCFLQDVVVTFLFFSGSGLLGSVIKGIYAKFFLHVSYPFLLGRNFKIISPSKVRIGKNVWVKDNVTLFASGEIKIGDNVVIYERVSVWSGIKGIVIGNGVWISSNCFIVGTGGYISVGNNVLIADSVRMYTFDHRFRDINIPIRDQGIKAGDITIEDNVWIGSGATILKGVKIGKGSVVGAGAVVTRDVPSHVVVAGVPAKIIKRFRVNI